MPKTMQIICLSHVAGLDQPFTMALRLFFCIESRATLLVGGSNDVGQQACNMHKRIYTNDKSILTSKWRQKTYICHPYIYVCKAWIGCIWLIYIYICWYRGLHTKRSQYIYIYIYIYIYTLESWRKRLNLARTAQYGYRKLWYITLSFYVC